MLNIPMSREITYYNFPRQKYFKWHHKFAINNEPFFEEDVPFKLSYYIIDGRIKNYESLTYYLNILSVVEVEL